MIEIHLLGTWFFHGTWFCALGVIIMISGMMHDGNNSECFKGSGAQRGLSPVARYLLLQQWQVFWRLNITHAHLPCIPVTSSYMDKTRNSSTQSIQLQCDFKPTTGFHEFSSSLRLGTRWLVFKTASWLSCLILREGWPRKLWNMELWIVVCRYV